MYRRALQFCIRLYWDFWWSVCSNGACARMERLTAHVFRPCLSSSNSIGHVFHFHYIQKDPYLRSPWCSVCQPWSTSHLRLLVDNDRTVQDPGCFTVTSQIIEGSHHQCQLVSLIECCFQTNEVCRFTSCFMLQARLRVSNSRSLLLLIRNTHYRVPYGIHTFPCLLWQIWVLFKPAIPHHHAKQPCLACLLTKRQQCLIASRFGRCHDNTDEPFFHKQYVWMMMRKPSPETMWRPLPLTDPWIVPLLWGQAQPYLYWSTDPGMMRQRSRNQQTSFKHPGNFPQA